MLPAFVQMASFLALCPNSIVVGCTLVLKQYKKGQDAGKSGSKKLSVELLNL